MQTTVEKIDIPSNKRMIVISDIHGHYNHLKNLLKKVNFSEDDILFILGDMVEKGPSSIKTLRYIMKLCENYNVYPLIGNVDETRLLWLDPNSKNSEKVFEYIQRMKKYWASSFFLDMCDELNIEINNPKDIQNAREQINVKFEKELNFIRSLPTIIETQKYIFVHGGVPSDKVEDLAGTDAHQYLKNDAFMEKGLKFNKYIVVGHWPVTLYSDKIASLNPIINKDQRIISIDGGCGLKQDGQLNALIIPNIDYDEISFEKYDDFPVGTAKTPQEESANSINIRYSDNKIKILEMCEEFSFAEHKSTGYRLWIHNDYINSFNENATCDDYTDYVLPVNIGDELSIIKKTSKGYLVKKDGISGWYFGEIAPKLS